MSPTAFTMTEMADHDGPEWAITMTETRIKGDELIALVLTHGRQHLLNFFPLPHGQGSFAATLGPSRRAVACFGKAGRKLGSSWSLERIFRWSGCRGSSTTSFHLS